MKVQFILVLAITLLAPIVYPAPADQAEIYPDQEITTDVQENNDVVAEEQPQQFANIFDFMNSIWQSMMLPLHSLFSHPARAGGDIFNHPLEGMFDHHAEENSELSVKKVQQSTGELDGADFSSTLHHIVNEDGEVVGHVKHTSFSNAAYYDDSETEQVSDDTVSEDINDVYKDMPVYEDMSEDADVPEEVESEESDGNAETDDSDAAEALSNKPGKNEYEDWDINSPFYDGDESDLRDMFKNLETYKRPSFKEKN